MQDDQTRARQHLLVQGYTLYTAEAAVSLLLLGSTTLLDPEHAWAVEMDQTSWNHTDRLLGQVDSPLQQLLSASAETCRQGGQPGVLLHTQGATMLTQLRTNDVRNSRMTIEQAVILGHQPPTEKLQAFGDEAIQREAQRRGIIPKPEPVEGNGPGVRE